MAEEEKKKTAPTQGRNPDLDPDSKHRGSVGEEEKKEEEDVFDPNSDTCKTCGGCGGEE